LSLHVLFLAPDTHVYNHAFLRGLKSIGARVSAIGPAPREHVAAAALDLCDDYRECARILDADELLPRARELAGTNGFERIETIDEPLVEPAAHLREKLGVTGLSVATARLCRDKVAMKEHLRAHGIACAQSAGVSDERELREFVERVGYPVIVKPIAGFGSLDTHRVDDARALAQLLPQLRLGEVERIAVEEFVDGHEGFFDAIVGSEGVRHDFAAHYFPGCLEANRNRWISPQIAVTNRIEGEGYVELRALGRRVIDVLGLRGTGTHMEWFFGPSGMKVSEIGARPAGEKIWDMYRVANDFDVFREWALAVCGMPSERAPSRRLAAGSVQIRPDRDGRIASHSGVDAAFERFGSWIYEHELPPPGTPTKALDRGWLVNTWFRLTHADYDELRSAMTFLGETVKTTAR
jgi:biotin carboxylase